MNTATPPVLSLLDLKQGVASKVGQMYRPPVAANSATGFGDPNYLRRNSAQTTTASAFFVLSVPCYGGCARETFGSAGFLGYRFANLRTAAKHGSSRFSDVNASGDDARVLNRAGYWELSMGKRLYLFNKSALVEAAHGYGLNRVIKALDGAGAITKRDSDRKRNTKNYRIPGGGTPGFYVIDPEALEGEGGSV